MPRVKPPKHLSPEARKWFIAITKDYELNSDHAALLLLQTGLEAWDECRLCRSDVAKNGFTILGRFNEKRPNPAVSSMARSRSAMLRAFTALGLSFATPEEKD
jgi:P27 family predicted phage terminase small subunit